MDEVTYYELIWGIPSLFLLSSIHRRLGYHKPRVYPKKEGKMKATSKIGKSKAQGKRSEKEFTLPASETISEWFSQDQEEKLRKLTDANYHKYSVYEVYSEHVRMI